MAKQSKGVAGNPHEVGVPGAKRVVKGEIVRNWKEPGGEHPRRKRRGG